MSDALSNVNDGALPRELLTISSRYYFHREVPSQMFGSVRNTFPSPALSDGNSRIGFT